MSQFAVYANADAASRKVVPYFLDVQSDLIETIGSRVVVPLVTVERAGGVIERLMPCLVVGERRMVMDTAQIMGIPMRMIGKRVADMSDERHAILSAIDLLTHGI
ncbi:CcdB family protein [Luteimonas sp. 3794]|uniref:CcdB family protein n=1 Tax=Luteimonas sp. 3794 TaxID=2817730 RepID=UPI002858A110|nr:CcdB family protein [Luteimonas sp. 3794]MDR6991185.1 toxin CcdB [Luteimonas sp. 3794]